MKKLIIIGAGGNGKVVYDIAKLNGYDDIKFIDDIFFNKKYPYEIIGNISILEKKEFQEWDYAVAIGDCYARKKYSLLLKQKKLNQPILIHPSAIIDKTVVIGAGTVVMANVVINAFSSIGQNCIINTSSSIDHDCIIKSFTHIAPGVNISGSTIVGEYCWIGTGANVINNISIFDNVYIGAGTTIIKDIKEPGKYVGLPLRRIA